MSPNNSEIPYGTLDLMVLKTLAGMGPLHGYGIARRIEQVAEGALALNQGTIYPALLRLEQKGWIKSDWGTSENNRRARFYAITAAGKRHLVGGSRQLGQDGRDRQSPAHHGLIVRPFLSRVLDVILRRSRERRLADEVQSHLDLLTDEYVSRGLPVNEARLAARKTFGGVEQMKERYRDRRGFPMITELVQDTRYALRLMARERWFTAATVVALSLGIGATTTMVTILYCMNVRGLPFHEAASLVGVTGERTRSQGPQVPLTIFEQWRSASRSFEVLSAEIDSADQSRRRDARHRSVRRYLREFRRLRAAARAARGRTRFPSRGRSPRCRPGRNHRLSRLDRAIWIGSGYRRPHGPTERRNGDDRRRHAGRFRVSGRLADLAPARVVPRHSASRVSGPSASSAGWHAASPPNRHNPNWPRSCRR